jgi:signal transduction histidine kinase
MDRVDYDLEIVATSIDEILDETTRRLAPKIEQKNLTLSKEIEKAIIMVDPYKIQQVFTNLINNAINYTDEGSIYVEGRLDEDMYIIKISDTGIGIKPSQIDKIFKRFYRVDKTRSRKTGGSGLGLSISKNVVLRHGGNIYVDSTPQKGSTFIVELPRQTYSN